MKTRSDSDVGHVRKARQTFPLFGVTTGNHHPSHSSRPSPVQGELEIRTQRFKIEMTVSVKHTAAKSCEPGSTSKKHLEATLREGLFSVALRRHFAARRKVPRNRAWGRIPVPKVVRKGPGEGGLEGALEELKVVSGGE